MAWFAPLLAMMVTLGLTVFFACVIEDLLIGESISAGAIPQHGFLLKGLRVPGFKTL
jgi:hypothetical protein